MEEFTEKSGAEDTSARPTARMMRNVINQCVSKNMGNSVFALFLCSALRSLVISALVMPAASVLFMYMGSGNTLDMTAGALSVLCVALTLLSLFIALLFDYGLCAIFCRMVQRKKVSIGYLFIAFKNKKDFTRAAGAAALFVAIEFLVSAAGLILAYFLRSPISRIFPGDDFRSQAYRILIVIIPLFILTEIFLVFVWTIIYSERGTNALHAFRKSARMVAGNFFRFVGYELYAAGAALPVLIASVLLELWIPGEDTVSAMQLLKMLIQFAVIISEFIVLVRLNFSLPVYYFSMTGKIVFTVQRQIPFSQDTEDTAHDGAKGTESLPETTEQGPQN